MALVAPETLLLGVVLLTLGGVVVIARISGTQRSESDHRFSDRRGSDEYYFDPPNAGVGGTALIVSRQRTTFGIGIGLTCMVLLLLILAMTVGTYREQRREACWAQMETAAQIRGVQFDTSGRYDQSYIEEFYQSVSRLEEFALDKCGDLS